MKIKIKGTNYQRSLNQIAESLRFIGGEPLPGQPCMPGDYYLRKQDSQMIVFNGKNWEQIEHIPEVSDDAAMLQSLADTGVPIPSKMWAAAAGIDPVARHELLLTGELGTMYGCTIKSSVQVPDSYFGEGTRKARVSGYKAEHKTLRGMSTCVSYLDELGFFPNPTLPGEPIVKVPEQFSVSFKVQPRDINQDFDYRSFLDAADEFMTPRLLANLGPSQSFLDPAPSSLTGPAPASCDSILEVLREVQKVTAADAAVYKAEYKAEPRSAMKVMDMFSMPIKGSAGLVTLINSI